MTIPDPEPLGVCGHCGAKATYGPARSGQVTAEPCGHVTTLEEAERFFPARFKAIALEMLDVLAGSDEVAYPADAEVEVLAEILHRHEHLACAGLDDCGFAEVFRGDARDVITALSGYGYTLAFLGEVR